MLWSWWRTPKAKLANREPEPEPEPEEDATGSPPQPVASCSHSTGSSQWMYEVSDPALWGEVSENARAVLIDCGLVAFHNRTSRYPASTRDGGLGGEVRSFTNDLLYSCLQTGENVSVTGSTIHHPQ